MSSRQRKRRSKSWSNFSKIVNTSIELERKQNKNTKKKKFSFLRKFTKKNKNKNMPEGNEKKKNLKLLYFRPQISELQNQLQTLKWKKKSIFRIQSPLNLDRQILAYNKKLKEMNKEHKQLEEAIGKIQNYLQTYGNESNQACVQVNINISKPSKYRGKEALLNSKSEEKILDLSFLEKNKIKRNDSIGTINFENNILLLAPPSPKLIKINQRIKKIKHGKEKKIKLLKRGIKVQKEKDQQGNVLRKKIEDLRKDLKDMTQETNNLINMVYEKKNELKLYQIESAPNTEKKELLFFHNNMKESLTNTYQTIKKKTIKLQYIVDNMISNRKRSISFHTRFKDLNANTKKLEMENTILLKEIIEIRELLDLNKNFFETTSEDNLSSNEFTDFVFVENGKGKEKGKEKEKEKGKGKGKEKGKGKGKEKGKKNGKENEIEKNKNENEKETTNYEDEKENVNKQIESVGEHDGKNPQLIKKQLSSNPEYSVTFPIYQSNSKILTLFNGPNDESDSKISINSKNQKKKYPFIANDFKGGGKKGNEKIKKKNFQTLDQLLQIPKAVNYFKEFLSSQFCQENIMFFEEVKIFKQFQGSQKQLIKSAKKIYQTYIIPGSIFEINIISEMRNDIIKNFDEKNYSRTLFNKAQNVVLNHMEFNSWKPFQQSILYQKLIKSLNKDPNFIFSHNRKKLKLIKGYHKKRALNEEFQVNGKLFPTYRVAEDLLKALLSILQAHYSVSKQEINLKNISKSIPFRRFVKMTSELQFVKLDETPINEKLCFFLNLFNLLSLHSMIINDIPRDLNSKRKFLKDSQYFIGDSYFSLKDIYHGILRANNHPRNYGNTYFKVNDKRLKYSLSSIDPRIHFMLINHSFQEFQSYFKIFDIGNLNNYLDEITTQTLGKIIQFKNNKVLFPKLFNRIQTDFGGKEILLNLISLYLPKNLFFSHLINSKLKFIEPNLSNVKICLDLKSSFFKKNVLN
ncbi:electron carrier/ protein disulfide oxidoreductase [Anaeramoeba flamelloides]|uniref:Electron carrier/ protein disulfide oxidoreductase n=1 Tax=Anaeramoeba flamelloides TaxID=1746091 RepID=A0AAV8AE92_9EUKA|nr:electron carrier/ protein disulfide oxidoreductase [Anaeramoeba flamelloides]